MRLTCPTCNQIIKVADGSVGEVIACPTCRQKLRVPDSPEAKPAPVDRTMLGHVQEAPREPRAPEPRSREREPEPPPVRARPREGWDDDEPRSRRRRDYDDDDYDDYRPRRKEVNTGMAVASLVCGIIGAVTFWCVFTGPLCGALGIIFGAIHLGSKVQEGNGMAIGGLSTGAAAIVFFLVFLFIALASPGNSLFWFGRR